MKKAISRAIIVALVGVAPASVTQPAAAKAAPVMGAACTAAANQQAEGFQGPPPNESSVVQMQHLLFLVERVLTYLDANCAGDPDFEAQKATYSKLFSDTQNTCKQVASSESLCVPRRYGS
jgi:hypothetical protein